MNTYYEGKCLYTGEDLPMYGIWHGKYYEVRKHTMKSGRHRVTVLDCPMSPLRFTYDSKVDADLIFKKAVRREHKKEQDD